MNNITPSSIMDLSVSYPPSERDPNRTMYVGTFRQMYETLYLRDGDWLSTKMARFLPALVETIMRERQIDQQEAFKLIKEELNVLDKNAFEALVRYVESMNETEAIFSEFSRKLPAPGIEGGNN